VQHGPFGAAVFVEVWAGVLALVAMRQKARWYQETRFVLQRLTLWCLQGSAGAQSQHSRRML